MWKGKGGEEAKGCTVAEADRWFGRTEEAKQGSVEASEQTAWCIESRCIIHQRWEAEQVQPAVEFWHTSCRAAIAKYQAGRGNICSSGLCPSVNAPTVPTARCLYWTVSSQKQQQQLSDIITFFHFWLCTSRRSWRTMHSAAPVQLTV